MMYYLELDESHTFRKKHRQARFWFMYCETLVQFDVPPTRLGRAYYEASVEKHRSPTSFSKRQMFIMLYQSLKEGFCIVKRNETARYAERMNQWRMRDRDTGRAIYDENQKDSYLEIAVNQKKAILPTKAQIKDWKESRAVLMARLNIITYRVGAEDYFSKMREKQNLVDSMVKLMSDVINFGHDVREEMTGYRSSKHGFGLWRPVNQQIWDVIMEDEFTLSEGDTIMVVVASANPLPQFSSAQSPTLRTASDG